MPPKQRVKRGDIFWVNLPQSESEGTEQYKRRPCVILSSDAINDDESIKGYVVAPLTTNLEKGGKYFRLKLPIKLKGQPKQQENVLLVEQIRFISKDRLDSERLASLDKLVLGMIEVSLKYVLYMA